MNYMRYIHDGFSFNNRQMLFIYSHNIIQNRKGKVPTLGFWRLDDGGLYKSPVAYFAMFQSPHQPSNYLCHILLGQFMMEKIISNVEDFINRAENASGKISWKIHH